MIAEPRIWSHITDELPSGHPLNKNGGGIYCKRCDRMVHCGVANECMCAWVETGEGNYCFYCFVVVAGRAEVKDSPVESLLLLRPELALEL